MKWLRRLIPLGILLLIIAANVTIWVQREQIADWFRLRNYTAPTAIAELASDDTMTPEAKRLFYVNHPLLEGRDAFNGHCSDKSEQTSVLGCYHGNRQGIYIYAVTDERLNGVRQVTAAHEMLHQAYDRLSRGEKASVDKQLVDYYATVTDERLKDKIESYRKANADVVNEMHSIFGSEVGKLPVGLETYYARYFTDRSKVTGFSDSYQAEFTRREAEVAKDDAQLADMKDKIDAHKTSLTAKMAELKTKNQAIDAATANRDQAAYSTAVNDYNALVANYNSELDTTRKLIAQYNQLTTERNTIAFQEQQLQEALDSHLTSSPAQQ